MKKPVLCSQIVFTVLLVAGGILAAPPASGDRGGSTGTVPVPGGRPVQQIRPAAAGVSSLGLRLKLPFPEGERFEVYQGNHGSFSHAGLNRYAWDFGLPEGTPVLASAAGRVVRVKQDSASGGTSPDNFAHGNTVVLDHGRGLFTQYLHLKKGSVLVQEGDLVRAGQILARSGNTGFSSTPHLHFQVQDALGQSLPARFVDVQGDGIPRSGEFVVSANDGQGTSPYAGESLLPRNVFTGNGISLDFADLPAHLLQADRTYTLRGTIARSARKVAVYLMSSRGGEPVHTVYCDVDSNGRFIGKLELKKLRESEAWSQALNQSNPFALAIAPVDDDGSFWSSFSVPVTVR